MPARELHYTKGKSDKFWTISLKGRQHTVVYGRIGTTGRTLTKSFDTPSEARASYDRLIESKISKGYADASLEKERATKKGSAKNQTVRKKAVKKNTAKKRPAGKSVKKSGAAAGGGKTRTTSSRQTAAAGMGLNDLTRRKNMHHCQYGNPRKMAEQCHYVWIWFFRHLRIQEPWIDAAVWTIGPTVLVRPACTALDESHRSFVRPHEIYFEVKSYKQERRKIEKQKGVDADTVKEELQALESELLKQMQEAIVKGLEHKQVRKHYALYNPDDRPFTVLVTTEDQGLHRSEFTVAWKNRRGLSAAQIRRQLAGRKGSKPVIEQQGPSIQRQHLDKLAVKRKQEWKEYHEYWGEEKKKAQSRKPTIRRKLARQIEQGEAELSGNSRPRRRRKSGASKEFLLSLNDGNQHDRQVFATVTLDQLADFVATYPWTRFDPDDNRIWEYSTAFMDPLFRKAKSSSRHALWAKLNRVQKSFYVMLNFIGETDNGGVWQFLFNSPELSLAALEAMNDLGAKQLARDYQATLEEFLGQARSLSDLRKRFNDRNLSSKKRWQAFADGYKELKTAAKIEKYFYTTAFRKRLCKMIAYEIEHSYHLFAKVELPAGV